MSATASLRTGDRTLELPVVVVGTDDEHAIDISSLRSQTGLHHARRGLRQYRVVPERHHLYGEEGILRYRGIPIEVLAEKSNFVESACLLIWGCLPTQEQLETFSSQDHEQNCSTSTVRMVGSSGANLFASVAAGVSGTSRSAPTPPWYRCSRRSSSRIPP